MSTLPAPEPLFLPTGSAPVFATLHRTAASAGAAATATAVILSPPFGWEEVCAYRSLRRWAEQLAGAGHPTLRMSFPGTGDSGGDPSDPDRLGAWVAGVGTAARHLRAATGARRVVGVGIGLGGLVTCLAAADGAEIDDFVLWATPARGRTLVRQLRAFSQLERSTFSQGTQPPPPIPDGQLEAGGFVLTPETRAALDAIDLTSLELSGERRALLLERDGLPVDGDLRARLESLGVTVTTAAGDGFGDMTSTPQLARPPLTVIETVAAWLRDAPAVREADGVVDQAPGMAGPATELTVGGVDGAVRESAVSIPLAAGRLAAVLAEPAQPRTDGLGVVLLNAGAVRRIGPSRLWVEAARRWAAAGVPVLRLDLEAIGDSDGDEAPYRDDAALYTPAFVPDVITAMDYLAQHGIADRFVLGGLCSGAFWSFHAALRDPRVQAVMLLNPRALIWTAGLGPGRDLRALFTQRPSLSKLRRLATGPRLHAFVRWLAATPARLLRRMWSRESETSAAERELDSALARFLSSGRRALVLFSAHEPLHAELERTGRLDRLRAAPAVTVDYIDVRDHTMRPSWAQAEVHASLDRALARETGAVTTS